jgi:hypothetical protein
MTINEGKFILVNWKELLCRSDPKWCSVLHLYLEVRSQISVRHQDVSRQQLSPINAYFYLSARYQYHKLNDTFAQFVTPIIRRFQVTFIGRIKVICWNDMKAPKEMQHCPNLHDKALIFNFISTIFQIKHRLNKIKTKYFSQFLTKLDR